MVWISDCPKSELQNLGTKSQSFLYVIFFFYLKRSRLVFHLYSERFSSDFGQKILSENGTKWFGVPTLGLKCPVSNPTKVICPKSERVFGALLYYVCNYEIFILKIFGSKICRAAEPGYTRLPLRPKTARWRNKIQSRCSKIISSVL